MNKQELIERIEKLPCFEGPIACTVTVNREWILNSIEQLDQPQKVTVPQFVVDWIEKIKGKGEPLYYALDHTPPEEVDLWFCEDEVNRQNIFALAWINGYTIEKEKRYIVKIIGITDYNSYLNYRKAEKAWTIESKMEIDAIRTNHTYEELEQAGFGWVFDCPGVEIEEVEE